MDLVASPLLAIVLGKQSPWNSGAAPSWLSICRASGQMSGGWSPWADRKELAEMAVQTVGAETKLFQLTKSCKSPRLTIMFSGIKTCVSSSMPIRPHYIPNIYHSSGKQAIAQSRSYSCDTIMMRQAEWDVSNLISDFLQFSDEN
jgi:hypothetical protein